MTLLGADMSGGPSQWGNSQRRALGILALAAVVVVAGAALATYLLAGTQSNLFWGLLILVALVLAFVLYLMLTKPQATTSEGAHLGPSGPAVMGEPAAAPAPTGAEPHGPRSITLRCGDCSTVFDVPDNGERPLYHTCPGCGAEGVLREAPAPEPAAPAPVAAPPSAPAAESPWARPAEPEPRPEPEMYAPPPPPADAAQPRRLKLRCGGCKQVFVIEDSGERPLRRPCPHCGRMGEIR